MDASKMTGGPIPTLIKLDLTKPAAGQKNLMNRWHNDIPFVASVKPGSIFKIDCLEWTGGQVKNTDNADDLRDIDLTSVHQLTGPIEVQGAEPGDMIEVIFHDVAFHPDAPWGFSGIFERENGGGLFAGPEDFKEYHAAKAIWDLTGVYATSRHIPGVRLAGVPHPGLVGTLPSAELLAKWNERECGLIEACKVNGVEKVPVVALPPNKQGAYVGQDLPDAVREKIYREGARTIPGREHGGNCDIKNLSRGSKAYLPVFQSGAGLAIGDLHFSQGDGELAFCGAIEMAGTVTMEINVLKNGVELLGNGTMPVYLPSPVDPMYSDKIVFQGLGVDMHGDGRQMNMCATTAYKEAAKNCIKFLQVLGYTREQAILLLTAAPVESHVAAIVDSPNACVTMELPKAIFDRDLAITAKGFEKRDYGQAAVRSDAKAGMYSK